jgi:hypothetical protein
MWGTRRLLLRSINKERWLGFARRFQPTYAGANVGHPSFSVRFPVDRLGNESADEGLRLLLRMTSKSNPISFRFALGVLAGLGFWLGGYSEQGLGYAEGGSD